jgi:hypothetical protein
MWGQPIYKDTPSVFIGEVIMFRVPFDGSLLSILDILDVPGLSPQLVIDTSSRFRFPSTDPGYCI